MAPTDLPPRFFKAYISQFSSDSMMIPVSYYNELPSRLPRTATLQGTGGCVWKVAMKKKQDEVHFDQGWSKFVKDNSLVDGDFLTFVYDGDSVFEVSIYGLDTFKETRAVATEFEDDTEDSVISISSDDDTEMAVTVPSSKNKGKKKKRDDDITPKTKNKGKKKKRADSESMDDDDDSDYIEAFDRWDVTEDSSSDSSYCLDIDDTTTAIVKAKVRKEKKQDLPKPGKRMSKVRPKIKNPEAYLDDPNNIHLETTVKNRKYELLVHAQLVKDYCLKFEDRIDYIDRFGKLPAKTASWKDERVCIKKWHLICARNKLKGNDRILCELLRNKNLVYAIKVHVVRAKFL